MNRAASESDEGSLRRVLAQRATQLAKAREADDLDRGTPHLLLNLGEEKIVISARHVDAVVTGAEITKLPGLLAPWSGVIHRRGQLLAVLDLAGMLTGSASRPLDRVHLVIAHLRDRTVAIPTAGAPDSLQVRSSELVSAPPNSPLGEAATATWPPDLALVDLDILHDQLGLHLPANDSGAI
jgi:chemotaxis signal transduction protein